MAYSFCDTLVGSYLFQWVVNGRTLEGTQDPRVELGDAVVGLDEEDVVLTVDNGLQVDFVEFNALCLHQFH